jgi:transcription termination factor 2
LTTYGIVRSESNKNGAVTGVKWRRIILDEAHQIRNDESLTAEAVCRLSAQSRWALTGTPVHNKDKDMYSMLKFLRCPLLGNAQVRLPPNRRNVPIFLLQAWKRWVEDKEDQKRLHAVISSLMLRRTKEEMVEKGLLQTLPEKKLEMVNFQLDKDEMEVYLTVLAHSKTLFWKFLEQKGLKRDVACEVLVEKLQRGLQTKPVTKTTIFVLLLRLRQICCHPCLIMQVNNWRL